MRGVLILTEGRSGSNWLGSLTNSTGMMGKSSEWVDEYLLGINPRKVSCSEYVDKVLDMSSTDNEFFSIKLFPRHMIQFQNYFGLDFIKYIRERHDVLLLSLTRDDQLGQAISFSKAIQTGAWSSKFDQKRTPIYNFDQICRCFFMIGRSYDFWVSYAKITQSKVINFTYEELLENPSKWVDEIAKFAGVDYIIDNLKSDVQVQRNNQSEIWRKQFANDACTNEFISNTTPSVLPRRSISNIFRFLCGVHTKPKPYVAS